VLLEIFMPYYGDPALLREAVESVLAQDDPRWTLTVVDDAYPDTAPGEWVAQIPDDRVTYVRNVENLGVSGTFQRCVDLATGDWMTIMGCDDRLLPSYAGRMHAAAEAHPNAGYIQPGVHVIDDLGARARPLPDRVKDRYRPAVDGTTVLAGEPLVTTLVRGNWTYFPSICWRTALLTEHGFRPELEVVLDLSLQLDLLVAGHTMLLDPVPSFEYRRHAASVSSWSAADGSRFMEEKALLLRTASAVDQLGWDRAARSARWHWSSRLNALTRLPAAIRTLQISNVRPLLRHAFTSRIR
jgi:glycosyltransferase involved in cell wall biosynthesis